jgi:PH (Pleckstrin Homology) domain-containing protein
MSYVEKNLISGEQLVYETGIHWIVLFWPFVGAILIAGAGAAILAFRDSTAIGHGSAPAAMEILAACCLVAAAIIFAAAVLKKNATEMAVTNRRVIIKTGLASRRSLEIMLPKVESIGIDETFGGRMLGFGTVTIHGTGGTPEPFRRIAHPTEFRRAVQQQIDAAK